jgi:hypothetical protein
MSDYVEFNIRPMLPNQRGHKALDGNQYDVWVRWNRTIEAWYMDLTQLSDATISIKGMALLPGKELLSPYGYGHILGELWVEDTAGSDDDPTYEGMGDRWRVRYYPITV